MNSDLYHDTLNGKIKLYLEVTSQHSLVVWRIQLGVCLMWRTEAYSITVLFNLLKALRPK